MKNTNSTPSNMQPKHTTLIQLPVLNEWELYKNFFTLHTMSIGKNPQKIIWPLNGLWRFKAQAPFPSKLSGLGGDGGEIIAGLGLGAWVGVWGTVGLHSGEFRCSWIHCSLTKVSEVQGSLSLQSGVGNGKTGGGLLQSWGICWHKPEFWPSEILHTSFTQGWLLWQSASVRHEFVSVGGGLHSPGVCTQRPLFCPSKNTQRSISQGISVWQSASLVQEFVSTSTGESVLPVWEWKKHNKKRDRQITNRFITERHLSTPSLVYIFIIVFFKRRLLRYFYLISAVDKNWVSLRARRAWQSRHKVVHYRDPFTSFRMTSKCKYLDC